MSKDLIDTPFFADRFARRFRCCCQCRFFAANTVAANTPPIYRFAASSSSSSSYSGYATTEQLGAWQGTDGAVEFLRGWMVEWVGRTGGGEGDEGWRAVVGGILEEIEGGGEGDEMVAAATTTREYK